jgi:hypothetical protein
MIKLNKFSSTTTRRVVWRTVRQSFERNNPQSPWLADSSTVSRFRPTVPYSPLLTIFSKAVRIACWQHKNSRKQSTVTLATCSGTRQSETWIGATAWRNEDHSYKQGKASRDKIRPSEMIILVRKPPLRVHLYGNSHNPDVCRPSISTLYNLSIGHIFLVDVNNLCTCHYNSGHLAW